MINPWPNGFAQFAGDGSLKRVRLVAQSGADDAQLAHQDSGSIERSVFAALHGDDEKFAAGCHALHIARHIAARDHVQHHIGTATLRECKHLLNEILFMVLNGAICPELEAGRAFFAVAGRDDDLCAGGLGQLDGRGADAAAAAMHQQGLAGLQVSTIENIAPDREKGFGQPGGFH